MPTLTRKAKQANSSGESVPAKRTRKETLTKDNIPSIVKAVLDVMQTHDPEPRGEHQTSQNDAVGDGSSSGHNSNSQGSESKRRGGCRTTRRNIDSPVT